MPAMGCAVKLGGLHYGPMKDHPDDTRKVPTGKTRVYHAAAALGRRRFAKMTQRELKAHQQAAARARWAHHKKSP